jgi:hypothetical protein
MARQPAAAVSISASLVVDGVAAALRAMSSMPTAACPRSTDAENIESFIAARWRSRACMDGSERRSKRRGPIALSSFEVAWARRDDDRRTQQTALVDYLDREARANDGVQPGPRLTSNGSVKLEGRRGRH